MKGIDEMSRFDSTKDAKAHITLIQKVFNETIIPELQKRSENHDKSKLSSPEREMYDEYIPKLKETPFGSKEYVKVRKEMEKTALQHHFQENRHHPEHFENGISDMTIVDVVEMFCDWYAASLRSDTSFLDGLMFNKNKFKMSDELYEIFLNTYIEYFA